MNQHYEFWVRYYEELLNNEKLRQSNSFNQKIEGFTWKESALPVPMQETAVYMKTMYPGLLAGLGMSHNSGLADTSGDHPQTELQMGFSFDAVTGLPVIPGSTIKGILRSAFIRNPAYVQMLLEEITGKEYSIKKCKQLETEIFGTRHPYDPVKKDISSDTYKGKDVFLDAFPVKADAKNKLMGIDFITPHIADHAAYQGLTEPNPNAMLKVMPGVVFQFRFLLTDSTILNQAQKKKLFTQILTDFGAGAKTNTGYGRLETVTPDKKQYHYLKIDTASVHSDVPSHVDHRARNRRGNQNNQHNTRNFTESPVEFVNSETGTVTGFLPNNKIAFIKLDSGESGAIYFTKVCRERINPEDIHKYLTLGQKVSVWKNGYNASGKLQLTMIDPNQRGRR